MKPTRCKCGMAIMFVKTPGGKWTPLDVNPRRDGRFVVEKGVAREATDADKAPRFVSHWATCSKASEFKKGAIKR